MYITERGQIQGQLQREYEAWNSKEQTVGTVYGVKDVN